MGYYSVLILTPKDRERLHYKFDTIYFGDVENMMRVRLFDAIRLAQNMPFAEYVAVWHDGKQLLSVKIEH